MPNSRDRQDDSPHDFKQFGLGYDLGLDARRGCQHVDRGVVTVHESNHGEAPDRFLLSHRPHPKPHHSKFLNEGFGTSVVVDCDSKVDISRETGIATRRHGQASHETTSHTRMTKFSQNLGGSGDEAHNLMTRPGASMGRS